MEEFVAYVDNNSKNNEFFLEQFQNWLAKQKIEATNIQKYIVNCKYYLDYIEQEFMETMEEGCFLTCAFFEVYIKLNITEEDNQFIYDMVDSLKTFYQCMSELKYISSTDYVDLCDDLKQVLDNL